MQLRILQSYNSGNCEICNKKVKIRIPKAGSGVEVSYLCIKCIEERQIEILLEYIEKFGVKTEAL